MTPGLGDRGRRHRPGRRGRDLDHVTTHAEPTYVRHGVIHYAVANMPGAVPRTSTLALTNATLPYLLALAGKGFAGRWPRIRPCARASTWWTATSPTAVVRRGARPALRAARLAPRRLKPPARTTVGIMLRPVDT